MLRRLRHRATVQRYQLEAAEPTAAPPTCFTPQAWEELMRTVGSRPPESGAKGFGPVDRFGFDCIEFDERGSYGASGAVYSPDVDWGAERIKHWMNQPDNQIRLWTGDLHSHPGGYGRPSPRVGPALGDLGYVEAVFEHNPMMLWFAIPILTGTGLRVDPRVDCWMVRRDAPDDPLSSELRICDVSEFPQRQLNPEWEAQVAAPTGPDNLDLALLAELVGIEFAWSQSESGSWSAELDLERCPLRLSLPDGFPARPPRLQVRLAQRWLDAPAAWLLESPRRVETRLALLCLHTAEHFARRF